MRLSISHFYPHVFALLVLAASLAGSSVTAFAGEVGLAWDATTAPEVLGYKIYYGLVSDARVIDVGNVTTYTVKGLAPDTYWFCVAAYDLSFNESPCSNVVSITLPPPMYGFRDESARRSRGMFPQPEVYSRNLFLSHSGSRSHLWLVDYGRAIGSLRNDVALESPFTARHRFLLDQHP